MKNVFVTVGTTSFDRMIGRVLDKEFLQELEKQGFSKVTLQIGRGMQPLIPTSNIFIEWFRLKNTISDDILSSSLVISHAGAGSCLEVLEKQKPLIVVVNEDLMNNHQIELASKLQEEGYAHMCTPETLCSTIVETNISNSVPFPACQTQTFPNYIKRLMGYS